MPQNKEYIYICLGHQSFRIVGVIRQKLNTMALMVKIDNLLLFEVVKVYISYFIFKMFSKYTNKATSCRY